MLLAAAALALSACGSGDGARDSAAGEDLPTLVIGGIPDQEASLLEERFSGLAAHLEQQVAIPVRYQPSTDYSAVVTAFANGDFTLGWFGGLTGVQARLETPGARAVAQRPIDRTFTSVFVVGQGVEADSVADLAGTRFTFGSESSTSGHLMPRFFLDEAGIDPESDFDGSPGYSGSHDRTSGPACSPGRSPSPCTRSGCSAGSAPTSPTRSTGVRCARCGPAVRAGPPCCSTACCRRPCRSS